MKTKFILSAAMISATLLAPMTASAGDDYDVTVGVDAVSEYIFRGVKLGEYSIQPYAEVAIGNFTVGTWANTGIGKRSDLNADEIDIYGSYGFELTDTVSASVGATLYHYPQFGGLFDVGTDAGDGSTIEFSGGVEFDTVLSPSASAYYDISLEAFTLEGSIGHSFTSGGPTSFDVGATAGLVAADGPGDYEYGLVSGTANYAITDDAGVYVGANYSLSSEDTLGLTTSKDNSFWFGTGISSTF